MHGTPETLPPTLCIDLRADGSAQRDDALVDDAVVDLHTITPLAQHPRLVQAIEMLAHVGLGGGNEAQKLADVFFAWTQGIDDLQAHR